MGQGESLLDTDAHHADNESTTTKSTPRQPRYQWLSRSPKHGPDDNHSMSSDIISYVRNNKFWAQRAEGPAGGCLYANGTRHLQDHNSTFQYGQRQRNESDGSQATSVTTGYIPATTSGSVTDHSIPSIATITECPSDNESRLLGDCRSQSNDTLPLVADNQDTIQHSRPAGSHGADITDNMEVNVSRYEGGAPQKVGAGERQRSKTPDGRLMQNVKPAVSRIRRSESTSKADKIGRGLDPSRRISDTSTSDVSGTFQIRKITPHKRDKPKAPGPPNSSGKKKIMLGVAGKRSLADRWGKMVDEYAGTYGSEEPKQDKHRVTHHPKVTRLSDSDKYDNVKVSISKSMPHVARERSRTVSAVESDSAVSDASARSWNPFHRRGAKADAQSQQQRSRSVTDLKASGHANVSRHSGGDVQQQRQVLKQSNGGSHQVYKQATGSGHGNQVARHGGGSYAQVKHSGRGHESKGHQNVKMASVERSVTATRQQVIQRTETTPFTHSATKSQATPMTPKNRQMVSNVSQQQVNSSYAFPISASDQHIKKELNSTKKVASGGKSAQHSATSKTRTVPKNHSTIGGNKKAESVKIIATETNESTKKKNPSKKKDKLFEDKAADIVDDVITKALDFIYGPPIRKHKHKGKNVKIMTGRDSTNHSAVNVSDSQTFSRSTDQRHNVDQRTSVTQNVRDQMVSKVYKQRRKTNEAQRRALAGSMPNLHAASHKVEMDREQWAASRPAPERHTRGRFISPVAQKAKSSRKYASNYELNVLPYGSEYLDNDGMMSPTSSVFTDNSRHYDHYDFSGRHRNTLSSAASGSYNRDRMLSPRTVLKHSNYKVHEDNLIKPPHFSDSEYSTTLEIKHSKGQEPLKKGKENTTGGSLFSTMDRGPGRVNPPTLTKGTVTRVMYEMSGNEYNAQPRQSLSPVTISLGDSNQQRLQHRPHVSEPELNLYSSQSSLYGQEMRLTHVDHPSQPHIYHVQGKVQARSDYPSSYQATLTPAPVQLQSASPQKVNLLVDVAKATSGQHNAAALSPSAANLSSIREIDECNYVAIKRDALHQANTGTMKSQPQRMDFVIDGQSQSQASGSSPDVMMNSKQVLNFYVFNQLKPELEKATAEYNNREIDAIFDPYNVDRKGKPQVDHDKMDFDEYDASAGMETEMREYRIYHKQTQTAGEESPSPPPRRPRKPKTTESVHKIIKQHRPLSPKVKHKEITHYITSEREIEKLPPEITVSEISVQTDSPLDHEYEEPVVQKVVKQKKRAPSPPPRFKNIDFGMSETFVTQTLPVPYITETRQMQSSEEFINPPSPPPEPQGRSIPVQKHETTREDFMEVLDREYLRSSKPEMEETIDIFDAKRKTDSEGEESEEEIIETVIIEEKEQRIAMAIFEEIEFSSKKTEGGRVVEQVGEDGWKVPNFWLPEKYEAVVDRRKQKMTKVKKMEQEADHSRWSDGRTKLPALGALSGPLAMDMKPKILADEMMESSKLTHKTLSPFSNTPKERKSEGTSNEEHVQKEDQLKFVPFNTRMMMNGQVEREEPNMPDSKTRSSYSDVVKEVKNLGSLPRSKISLPDVPVRNFYQNEEDKLPEDLEHFDKMVMKMESELPHNKAQGRQVPINKSPQSYKGRGSTSIKRSSSKYEPNVSFGRKSGKTFVSKTDDFYFDPRKATQDYTNDQPQSPKIMSNQPLAGLDPSQVVHTNQSEPVLQTRIVEDKDGNLVKVTELKHTLTKTVEYSPEEEKHTKEPVSPMEEMTDNSYIDMNLVETITTKSVEEASDSDTPPPQSRSPKSPRYMGPEVVEETTVTRKPFSYDIRERSVNMDDGTGSGERKFHFDSRTKKLKKLQQKTEDGKYPFETMTTAL